MSAAANRKVVDRRRPAMPLISREGKVSQIRDIDKGIAPCSMRDEDPREALLKYAEVAQREPMFTAAWRETREVTVYASVKDEERKRARGQGRESRGRLVCTIIMYHACSGSFQYHSCSLAAPTPGLSSLNHIYWTGFAREIPKLE